MKRKKQIEVGQLAHVDKNSGFDQIRAALRKIPFHAIDTINWSEFSYCPKVCFKIAYTHESLVLFYEVIEKELRAFYNKINDPVYKDSCVEFFLSFDGLHYYNFEFNCIGTALVAYGDENKLNRKYMPIALIEEIKTLTKIYPLKGGETQWQLIANIPFEFFSAEQEPVKSLKDKTCFANFYKCGDELERPHYLSWNKVESVLPNFHLPAFFGDLIFK